MYQLDIKDKKILAELDLDARQSNAEIGKKVRLSKEVVKYRIDNMIKNGIIIRFHTVINYFKLGIQKYKLYLRLKNADKEKLEELCQFLKLNPHAEWVASCTGRWDVIVNFLVNNVNELDEEVMKIQNKYHDHIKEKAIATTLYLVHHLREYLGKSNVVENIIYHTSKDPKEEIDKTDNELLRLLANNARMPVTELASRMKTTSRVIQYRMRQLEKKQIILAYKCQLDARMMGNIFCKGIFYISNITGQQLKSFISYCSNIKEAVWPQQVIGNWDFELDIEVKDYERSQEIISEVKNRFAEIVSNSEFCIVSKEYKLDLFPDAYPKY
jgi:Lrp/AsnC family leucine-responsive transcriptional regulator